MDVGTLLIANAQSVRLVEPGGFSPRPIATDRDHCRVRCCASRATGRCHGPADLAGLPPRHNHGHLTRNQGGGADAHALSARQGWHQPSRALATSRYDWPR
jgi:hypothetical protein